MIENWDNFISLSYSHGNFPLVYNTLKEFNELIPQNTLSLMRSRYFDIVKLNMLMTKELIKLVQELEEKNIDIITFKGPTLSKLAYDDVISRQYLDLDILIKEDNIFEMALLLKKLNYKIDLDPKYLKNKTLFTIGSDFSIFSKNNIHIEVHWHLFRKLINSSINQYSIWDNKNIVSINDKEIATIEINNYLLYLCVHGSKHLWERIEWVNDIHMLISKNDIDWEYLILLSKELKVKKMFLLGILISDEFFSTNIPIFIFDKIKKDSTLKKSLEGILNTYKSKFTDKKDTKKEIVKRFIAISTLQDNFYETVKYFVSSIFKPTHYDIYFINLSKELSFLYYFTRPIRFIVNIFKS